MAWRREVQMAARWASFTPLKSFGSLTSKPPIMLSSQQSPCLSVSVVSRVLLRYPRGQAWPPYLL